MSSSVSLQHLSKQELLTTLQLLQEEQQLSYRYLQRLVRQTQEIMIPLSIFTRELSALESICKYLKEQLHLSYHRIAELLHRDDRTIWTTYQHARKKKQIPLQIKKSLSIPLHLFAERTLSVLETIVSYLKEQHDLSYKEISVLMHRNERTIWTVYQRARKKR